MFRPDPFSFLREYTQAWPPPWSPSLPARGFRNRPELVLIERTHLFKIGLLEVIEQFPDELGVPFFVPPWQLRFAILKLIPGEGYFRNSSGKGLMKAMGKSRRN